MFNEKIKSVLFCYFSFTCVQALGYTGTTQDLPSTRANTLIDDADDTQKQLDNELRDRMKFGRPKTVWVLHFPTQRISTTGRSYKQPRQPCNRRESNDWKCKCTRCKLPSTAFGVFSVTDWNYKNQNLWKKVYPECGGKAQSPVDLPYDSFIQVKGARQMLFKNYNVKPTSLTMMNDGKKVSFIGEWDSGSRPIIYGGAAHSRRYLFHSLVFHWPSEHTIGGLQYPMESQALHFSAEYPTLELAMEAAKKDKLAILGVANIYKFSNTNQNGLVQLLQAVKSVNFGNKSFPGRALSDFSPPLKEYAAYEGSLTTPPCTEAVLWLVRAKSLPITRELMDALETTLINRGQEQLHFRHSQPLNDRRVYFFN